MYNGSSSTNFLEDNGMDKTIENIFADLVSTMGSSSVPKHPDYRVGSDSVDLGYHTLENNAYRLLSSCSRAALTKHVLPKIKHCYELNDLDDNLLIKIFSHLTTRDLCSVAQTCRRLWEIAWSACLWRDVQIRYPQNASVALNVIARRGYSGQIRRLYLDGINEIANSLSIWSFSNLTSLTIRHAKRATDSDITTILDNCMQLRELDLTGCISLTKAHSATILRLESLDLSDCHGIDDAGLVQTLAHTPYLSRLYLRRCIRITDTSLVAIASYSSSLKQLSVSDCTRITDFGVRELAAKLGPSLRYLSVCKCDQVSDAGLMVVARHCYRLRYLNARGCEALSDSAMLLLARSCPRLRALDIGKCDIGDATLEALSTGCPNLKKLSLCGCERVTDAGLQALAYYVRGLQQLNIGDCSLVTWVGYRAVKRYCRRCVIEHTNPAFCS